MITKIYPADYLHIRSLTIDDVKLESCYNSNYYINNKDKTIIYESCNDEDCYYYYRVSIVDGEKTRKYLGIDHDYGDTSIFERKPGDCGIYSDENGYYVKLDTTIC